MQSFLCRGNQQARHGQRRGRLRLGKLFGTSGIRGDARTKVTEAFALKLGSALASQIGGSGSVCVGCDHRTTSDALKRALAGGLALAGVDVFDLGYAPTPVLAFATREFRARAGVSVTGSHNPPKDNGVKCYTGEGMEYTPTEEEALENLVLGRPPPLAPWNQLGRQQQAGHLDESYKEAVLRDIGGFDRRLKVVVDCANGTACNFTPNLLSTLGCEVTTVNSHPDGHFPGRHPEPNPESLAETAKLVHASGADIGVAHDGDADRLSVIDENGNYVTNDTVLAFFARQLLREHGPGLIVTSIDTSRRIDAVVEPLEGRVERTSLGKTHVALRESRSSLRLCCEPWKIIDPAWGYWGDAIHAALVLAKELAKLSGKATALFEGIPNYPQKRLQISCPEDLKTSGMKVIEARLEKETDVSEVWTKDGIRVNYTDGSWILIRKSGTEPKIRIYCEATTEAKLNSLVERGRGLVQDAIRAS